MISSSLQLSVSLLSWYEQKSRVFPWRTFVHPYTTWVCEVMSQQTTLQVVLPKYKKFIDELPDIKSLALCSEEKLRYLWQGMGYYSRAANLKKGANYILENFHDTFPSSYEQWLRVPGCGPYTASMIASICFGEPTPALDGNIARVTSRLLEIENIWNENGKKIALDYLNKHIDKKNPGEFNQALMDIGSTVCIKSVPKCNLCPLTRFCRSYKNNSWNLYPSKKVRPDEIAIEIAVVVFIDSHQRIFISKRNNGFLKKTVGFPLLDSKTNQFILKNTLDVLNAKKIIHTSLEKTFNHTITRHKVLGRILIISVTQNMDNEIQNIFPSLIPDFHDMEHWQPISQIHNFLSSSLDTKAANIIHKHFSVKI